MAMHDSQQYPCNPYSIKNVEDIVVFSVESVKLSFLK